MSPGGLAAELNTVSPTDFVEDTFDGWVLVTTPSSRVFPDPCLSRDTSGAFCVHSQSRPLWCCQFPTYGTFLKIHTKGSYYGIRLSTSQYNVCIGPHTAKGNFRMEGVADRGSAR